MDNRDIYELMDKFESSAMNVMELEQAGTRIVMKKENSSNQNLVYKEKVQETVTSPTTDYAEVKSPLVGVFYKASSPEAAPFVKVGDKVSKGQVLCLIEAMKMMNELKSPVDGFIRNIGVENGKAVEYDQLLFEVEKC